MSSPESGFGNNIFKKVAGVAVGLTGIAIGAHLSSQEKLTTLKEGDPVSVNAIDSTYKKFSPETAEELEKIESSYVTLYREDHPEVSAQALSGRFKGLVAKYGDGLNVVMSNKPNKTPVERAEEKIFTKVLHQENERSHYFGGSVFLESDSDQYSESDQGKRFLSDSPELNSFVAEFSHHIDQDTKIRRLAVYGEDFLKTQFDQRKMYEQPGSVEVQAHSITESALRNYLYAKPENLGVSFEYIRNHFYHAYEALRNDPAGLDPEALSSLSMLYREKAGDHLDSLDGYENKFMADFAHFKALVGSTGLDEEKRKTIVNKASYYVLDRAKTSSERMAYVQASVPLLEATQDIGEKKFDKLPSLAQVPVLLAHPEVLGMWDEFFSDRDGRWRVLNSLSPEESVDYIQSITPLCRALVASVEQKHERGELTENEARSVVNEISSVQGVAQRLYRKNDTESNRESRDYFRSMGEHVRDLASKKAPINPASQ